MSNTPTEYPQNATDGATSEDSPPPGVSSANTTKPTQSGPSVSRRQLLAAGTALGITATAGCLGSDDDEEDDEPDGGNGTDDRDENGDDNGTENGADDSNGDDNGTENGADDPNGDENGDDNTQDPPEGEVVLSDLVIAGTNEITGEFPAGEDEPIEFLVANEGDAEDTFDINLQIAPLEDDTGGNEADWETSEVAESLSVTLAAEQSEPVVVDSVTPELDGGDYGVRVSSDDEELLGEFTVLGDAQLSIAVYTQEASEEHLVESGELTVTGDAGEVATIDLADEPTPTIPISLAEGDAYTLEVSAVNGGVFPGAEKSVTVEQGGTSVDVVAGYEFQPAENFKFTNYLLIEPRIDNGTEWSEREWFVYGTHAANGDHHTHYIRANTDGMPSHEVDESPREWGSDMDAIGDEIGSRYGAHSLRVDDERFFWPDSREQWEDSNNTTFYSPDRVSHVVALLGLDVITELDPEKQQYAGHETLHDEEVDVYDVSIDVLGSHYPDSKAYVDPETGYVVRVEHHRLDGINSRFSDGTDSYEMVEFFDHNEVNELDIEYIESLTDPIP